jgi:N-acetyl sugar amidotransferase
MNAEKDALYGLPKEVVFCKSCVISNQRPNSTIEFKHKPNSLKSTIAFDQGICDACKYASTKKNSIDWNARESELMELSQQVKNFPGPYNCIVPGSGGKDSFYQSHVLKNKYGFRPLTVTWAPNLYTNWGWQNFQSWIHSGFDNMLITPNGLTHRLLTRLAVDKLMHPFQPFILGQKGMAPRLAATLGIPLVFYGENEAEYGNPIADTESATRSFEYFSSQNKSDVFLAGVSLSELSNKYKISSEDLAQYLPENPEKLQDIGVVVHYLGYYLQWHPQSAYYYAVENGGFVPSPERTPGTYSKYNSIDDKVDDLHYWTTYIKFGIGRATYDASQEIRSGDISREEGVALVRKFDGEWPSRFEADLMKYLTIDERHGAEVLAAFESPGMSKEILFETAEQFRSPHLWSKIGGEWKLNHQVI